MRASLAACCARSSNSGPVIGPSWPRLRDSSKMATRSVESGQSLIAERMSGMQLLDPPLGLTIPFPDDLAPAGGLWLGAHGLAVRTESTFVSAMGPASGSSLEVLPYDEAG